MNKSFEELKAEAQKYSDLAFVRPLTDEEYHDYKALMKELFRVGEITFE